MLKKALFIFCLAGCAKHEYIEAENVYDVSGYAGEAYETTNSPCLDGILVNMSQSCTTPIQISGNGTFSLIQCHKANSAESPWDDWNFIVITSSGLIGPEDSAQFCMDLNATVYIQNRSN